MINLDDRIFEQVTDEKKFWLLMHIAKRMNANGFCWPKNSTLAADCRWSENTVQKVKKQLKDEGLIKVEKRSINGKQSSNAYYINTEFISIFVSLNKIKKHTQNLGTQNLGTQNAGTQDLGRELSINKNQVLTNNSSINKKEKEETVDALFQSDATPDLVLKKYFNEDSFPAALRLPDQPSTKTVDRWIQIYSEAYLNEQLQKFEAYLQKPKNKKNSAKKIKSASRTLNNWLKKEWIDCPDQRAVLKVFRAFWSENINSPFQFDSYQTSDDRRQLESFVDGMAKAGKDPVGQLRDALSNIPDFWKGKRLSSILKNFADISKPSGLRAKVASGRKESATIQNLDWL